MKGKNIGLGIFIISIGVMWLLMNLGIIDWSILDSLFTLWPLIFVVIGLNILFRHNSIAKSVLWVLFLATLIIYSYAANGTLRSDGSYKTGNVAITKLAETKYGQLQVSLGGSNFGIDAVSNQNDLIDAEIAENRIKHSINYSNGNETAKINFKMDKYWFFNFRNNEICNLHLNSDVVWDLNVDTGAVKGNLDLTGIKVRNLDMDTGAAKLDLALGAGYGNTNVKINAGASSINITVPSDAGVRVLMDGALNGTNLNSLGWARDGKYYVSPNYGNAAGKIDIEVDMGVGSFNIYES